MAEKKRVKLADFKAEAGKSKFLTLAVALGAGAMLASIASNSSLVQQGHVGKITEIDWIQIPESASRTIPRLDRVQFVTMGDTEVELAQVGEMPYAPTIVFSTGRTMTLGLLAQGGEKTTIHFKNDATATKSTDLTVENIASLVGKTLKCTKSYRDKENVIVRTNRDDPNAKARETYASVFEFVEV